MEINGFGMVYRRPANDQHEYVCVKSIVSNANDINAQTTTIEETQIHRPLLNQTNRMI